VCAGKLSASISVCAMLRRDEPRPSAVEILCALASWRLGG